MTMMMSMKRTTIIVIRSIRDEEQKYDCLAVKYVDTTEVKIVELLPGIRWVMLIRPLVIVFVVDNSLIVTARHIPVASAVFEEEGFQMGVQCKRIGMEMFIIFYLRRVGVTEKTVSPIKVGSPPRIKDI